MSVTDVDDKIINRASERGVHPLDLAREHEELYFNDMDKLGVSVFLRGEAVGKKNDERFEWGRVVLHCALFSPFAVHPLLTSDLIPFSLSLSLSCLHL